MRSCRLRSSLIRMNAIELEAMTKTFRRRGSLPVRAVDEGRGGPDVKGGVIMDRRGGGERSGVALQNWTTRRLL